MKFINMNSLQNIWLGILTNNKKKKHVNVVVKSFEDSIWQSLCLFLDLQGKILATMEKATSVKNFCLSILVFKKMNALEKFTQVKSDSCLGVQTAKHSRSQSV